MIKRLGEWFNRKCAKDMHLVTYYMYEIHTEFTDGSIRIHHFKKYTCLSKDYVLENQFIKKPIGCIINDGVAIPVNNNVKEIRISTVDSIELYCLSGSVFESSLNWWETRGRLLNKKQENEWVLKYKE